MIYIYFIIIRFYAIFLFQLFNVMPYFLHERKYWLYKSGAALENSQLVELIYYISMFWTEHPGQKGLSRSNFPKI